MQLATGWIDPKDPKANELAEGLMKTIAKMGGSAVYAAKVRKDAERNDAGSSCSAGRPSAIVVHAKGGDNKISEGD